MVEKPNIKQIIKVRDDILTKIYLSKEKPYINETPKGGHHLYFQYCPLLSRADALIDGPSGIDVRANGAHIVAEGSRGEWGEYKHIMGSITINDPLPKLSKDIQILFYPELSADERKAKKKPGPKPTPADKISPEDERNTCLDKLPYFQSLIHF